MIMGYNAQKTRVTEHNTVLLAKSEGCSDISLPCLCMYLEWCLTVVIELLVAIGC